MFNSVNALCNFPLKVDCRAGQKCGVLHEHRKNYNSAHVVISTEDRFAFILEVLEVYRVNVQMEERMRHQWP